MPKLARRAVEKYFARPQANWNIYKRLTNRRLNAIAHRRNVVSDLWQKLKRHQKIMMLIGLRVCKFAFFADTGVGKTVTSIAIFDHLIQHRQAKRVLVLVPRRPNRDEWFDELNKHAPHLRGRVMPSEIERKWSVVETDDTEFVFETYGGLMQMVCDTVYNKKKRKNKFKPSRSKLKRLCDQFDGVVFDESQNLKSKSKLPFRICRKIAQKCKFAFILTATPHGRKPEDLWAQMFLIDGGETLGETLGLFRAAYYKEKRGWWTMFEYTFDKSKEQALHHRLLNKSIRFKADQADLPHMNSYVKMINLPEEAEAYYARAKRTLLAGHNYREMNNAWLRMRQISSGFVGFHDDDTGSRASMEFDTNPKLDMLMSVLSGIDPADKVIVFVEYTWSGERIMRELKQAGIKAVHLHGKGKDPQLARRQFNTDPATRVLVLQNSFGVGLNIQAARYGIFFETPVSPDTRYQCVRRFERQFSKHKRVFCIDLVVRGTYDERILKELKAGRDTFRVIIDGERRRITDQPVRRDRPTVDGRPATVRHHLPPAASGRSRLAATAATSPVRRRALHL